MKKILIAYNPASGRGRIRKPWKRIGAFLPGFDIRLVNIQTDEHLLLPLLRETDIVCVIGGDGTIRNMVQRLVTSGLHKPLAVIPRGSANILAKSLHLPFSLRKTARIIRTGSALNIDIGSLETGEIFLSAFAAGFLSHGVSRTTRRAKKFFGFAGYLGTLARQIFLPLHDFTLATEESTLHEKGNSVLVVNSTKLFGIRARRAGGLTDGRFEGAILKNRTTLSFAVAVRDFYFRQSDSKHFSFTSGVSFRLEMPADVPVLIDGEPLSSRTSAVITVLPRHQQVLVSRRFAHSQK